ncbi:MAG: succinate dehydrogenase cytochrome b subunit [Gemmatimonadales bacterium]|nr:succinate dehydrogenase cytochrome b subunit [Gemmatimonadales bacterium]
MGWIAGFYRSTIGRKIVMAATGLLLVGFVAAHMTGNLLIFRGRDAFDAYSHFLQGLGGLLWLGRGILLASLLLHVHSAWTLTRQAQAARIDGYAESDPRAATRSARAMRWGGVLLLVFIVYHIFHLTVGSVHPDFRRGEAYGNVMTGLGVSWVALFYLAAMGALALHLRHGVSSLFQTLGVNHPHLNPVFAKVATALAFVVPLGFAAVPLAVLFGLVR